MSQATLPFILLLFEIFQTTVTGASVVPSTNGEYFYKPNHQLVEINKPQIIEGKYLDIDLEKMILTAFRNGKAEATYELLAKGRPGVWATPIGNFKVISKKEKLWSTNSVWMPWSIRFSGPFYIHETPFYANGHLVTSQYSGGCIRLARNAAEKVYHWADIGIPVIIH